MLISGYCRAGSLAINHCGGFLQLPNWIHRPVKLIDDPKTSLLSPRDVACSVIADVPDFWMDGLGENEEGHDLGVHNAERILAALDEAGLKIVRTR